MAKVLNKVSYVENLKKAIADVPDHPYHAGFKMQAHHLLSRDAFFKVDAKRGEFASKIEMLGYKINLAQNLVFLPCELEGACHLQVPLHRGDHTYVDHNTKDKDVYRPYHDEVADLIAKKTKKLMNNCTAECSVGRNNDTPRIQKVLDKLSIIVLKKIDSYELPLTRMHADFKLHNTKGCGNLKKVGASSSDCSKNRNHSAELKHRETGGLIDFPSVLENAGAATYKLKIYS